MWEVEVGGGRGGAEGGKKEEMVIVIARDRGVRGKMIVETGS